MWAEASDASATCAATIVTAHVSPFANEESGVSVNVLDPPLTVAVWPPLVEQEIVTHVPVTVTACENVTVTLVAGSTDVAPFAGVVEATDGVAAQLWNAAAPLRALGVVTVKSAELLSVSMQPPPLRAAAVL